MRTKRVGQDLGGKNRGTCVGDLCDTALGAYDAEQTNRSGSRFWGAGRNTSECFGQSDILVAWPAAHILVRCPVSGVGRLNGSLLFCLRKDVALCHTASRAWVGEWIVWGGRHISCAPSVSKSCKQGRFLTCTTQSKLTVQAVPAKSAIRWT